MVLILSLFFHQMNKFPTLEENVILDHIEDNNIIYMTFVDIGLYLILRNTKILTRHMRILLIQKMCMMEKVMMMMMMVNYTIQVVLKYN
ncbi:hypothetical protein Gotur_005021 [Gossypium turneri]